MCARWGLCEIGVCVYGRGGGITLCVCVYVDDDDEEASSAGLIPISSSSVPGLGNVNKVTGCLVRYTAKNIKNGLCDSGS